MFLIKKCVKINYINIIVLDQRKEEKVYKKIHN